MDDRLNLDYEEKEIVIQALARLTDRQKVAFLCWVVGFNQEETGVILGISQQGTASLLQRARARVRQNSSAF